MQDVDLTCAKSQLFVDGYCVIPNVLDEHTISRLSHVLDAIALDESEMGSAWFSHGNQRVFMLLNKHCEFMSLVDHRVATPLVSALLGKHFLLSSFTANITRPNNRPQHLHADQGYIPDPWCRAEQQM